MKYVIAIEKAIQVTIYEKQTPETKTKWPNDILHGKKKLCGILAEIAETANDLIEQSLTNERKA